MDNRTFDTTITYKSNCHYGESSSNASIALSLKEPTINFLDLHNITTDSNILYYNDTIEISVFVSDDGQTVQWGNVIFYFIDADDISKTKKQINTNPIPIDINGNASIQYIPHNNGEIVVEYFGEPYYKTVNQTYNFVLTPRPTYIEFENYSPYLIDEEETTTMEVKVIDEITNEPLEYGWVTFLNYHAYGMGVLESDKEKVIGNPQYLINGKASITYSPIQLGTNELLNNIELIAAIYNYDNELYGEKWKYYSQHQDWASIAIRKNNQINMSNPQIKNGNNYEQLGYNDYGIFVTQEKKSIMCSCQIMLGTNQFVTDLDNKHFVKFIIEGKKYSYETGEKIESDFRQVYDADYINETKHFNRLIDNLPIGLFKIYAQVENPTAQIDGNIFDIPVNVTNVEIENTNLPTQNKDERLQKIKDGIYLKSNTSDKFYIEVEPQSNNIALNLTPSEISLTSKTLNRNNIQCEITGVDNDDINILKNKKCYFWVSNTGQLFEGNIQYINNKLIAKPNDDLNFENINDYRIFAYISENTYTYNNGQTTITRKYDTIYSNSIIVKIRNEIDINLRINSIDNTYPGKIKYIIDGKNINDEINANIYIDNNFITSHNLNNVNQMITNSLPTQNAGTHIVKLTVTTPPYTNIVKSENYTIEQGTLKMSLNNISNNINTSLASDIILGIEHGNGGNIDNLNQSLLTAVLEDSNNNQQQIIGTNENNSPIKIIKMNNSYYQAIVTGSLYDNGNWKIKLNYSGDINYQQTNNDFFTFKTVNKKPYCVNISADKNKIVNRIVYNQTTEYINEILSDNTVKTNEITTYNSINQQVLVITKLSKNGDSPITIASITNLQGEYTINRPSNIGESAFTKYNTIEYTINPKHNLLNQYSHTTNNGITAFKNIFSNYQCTDNDMNALYIQAKNNKWTNLFLGYDSVVDTITIYGDDG